MVKGNSRQVIVVHNPDQKLFDQAIFILKEGLPGREGITDDALLKEAKHCINSPARKKHKRCLSGPLWAAAGASIMGIVWLLSSIC